MITPALLWSAWLPQGNEISASLLPVPFASLQVRTLVYQGEFEVLPRTEKDSHSALGAVLKERGTAHFKDHR